MSDDPHVGHPHARYDEIAGWYVEESARWEVGYLSPLPDDLAGSRVAEFACGPGRAARLLARRGANVVALDLSKELIAHAQTTERADPTGVQYLVGDATNLEWWDGERFDGVVCEMALMDIDDLDGVMRTAASVLEPGGWFAFSIFHPCFPGGAGSASGLPSWHPDRGYASEGWWSIGDIGIRGRVGANHRMLSTYLNALISAGFTIELTAEPAFNVPRFFSCRARHVTGRGGRWSVVEDENDATSPFRRCLDEDVSNEQRELAIVRHHLGIRIDTLQLGEQLPDLHGSRVSNTGRVSRRAAEGRDLADPK